MLVRAIDPIQAYVRNTRLDILTWNDAIADLFVDYGSLQPHERNTLRLLFVYRPYRTLIRAWEQMSRGVIPTFRAARAQAADMRLFDSLFEKLSDLSPEFRDWWQDLDEKGFDERIPVGGVKRAATGVNCHISACANSPMPRLCGQKLSADRSHCEPPWPSGLACIPRFTFPRRKFLVRP